MSFYKFVVLLSFFSIINQVDTFTDEDNSILTMLVEKLEFIQGKLAKVEKSEANLKQSISALIGTNAQFRLKITGLTEEMKEKDRRIKLLEQRLETYEGDNTKCGGEFDDKLEAYCDDVLSEKVPAVDANTRGKREIPVNVAFTAYLDHVIRNLGSDSPVVYNKVLLNEGGAYDPSTGVFIVPLPGVYLLSWSVTARRLSGEHSYDIWVRLMVNGEHQTGAVAESLNTYDDNQGSNTVVLRLNEGDKVWTEHYAGTTDMFGGDNERSTSFSGVLLYS